MPNSNITSLFEVVHFDVGYMWTTPISPHPHFHLHPFVPSHPSIKSNLSSCFLLPKRSSTCSFSYMCPMCLAASSRPAKSLSCVGGPTLRVRNCANLPKAPTLCNHDFTSDANSSNHRSSIDLNPNVCQLKPTHPTTVHVSMLTPSEGHFTSFPYSMRRSALPKRTLHHKEM
jgi:hypothetical protein